MRTRAKGEGREEVQRVGGTREPAGPCPGHLGLLGRERGERCRVSLIVGVLCPYHRPVHRSLTHALPTLCQALC